MSANNKSMATPLERPTGISKNIYVLTIAVVAVISFVAGTRGNEILGTIAPVLGLKVETGTLDLSSVQKTYQQLKVNYDGSIDEAKLIDGASRGLVAAAGDQYTVYMDAKEAKEFNDDLSGQIGGGIGAEIGLRNEVPTIIRILPGNPAERAGLLAGDIIIGVNDQPTNEWTATTTAEKIRGQVDTTVKVEVLRGGEEKSFTITRATVSNPSIQTSVENGIGTLTISRFDGETAALSQKAAQTFKQQNVRGIILDLRGNGGGYLTAAQDVSGLWLNDKVVVSERTNGKIVDELKSGNNALLAGVPTVVLVNGSSASASEIVAGALQDHKAATLIGEKTFGKGTVQKVLDLGAGTVLKVTIARWYTPNGKNITKEGITPNQVIELKAEDANAGRDPQLDAAKQKLG
ncbi:MAG: putative carboxyl-terminal protease [Candidatus Saccharibacteria bacterium]|nr:putative carboxyl-terminal protease [Candidatus Saccharibacteria bacterium]